MRIKTYDVELEHDSKHPILVKENSMNYPKAQSLCNPSIIADMLNVIFHANRKAEEYMWLIGIDTKNHPLGLFEFSHGTVNSSLFSPREIFIRLLLCGATNFVVAHNHPSGDSTPSQCDCEGTERLKQVADLLNIKLLDHIIVADSYFSFAENQLL